MSTFCSLRRSSRLVCLTWQIRVAFTQTGSSKPTFFDRTGCINNVHQLLPWQCKCISSSTGFHLFHPDCLIIMNRSWSRIYVCMHMYVCIFIHNSCHKYLVWCGTETISKSSDVLYRLWSLLDLNGKSRFRILQIISLGKRNRLMQVMLIEIIFFLLVGWFLFWFCFVCCLFFSLKNMQNSWSPLESSFAYHSWISGCFQSLIGPKLIIKVFLLYWFF